jgi:hypothetical protein
VEEGLLLFGIGAQVVVRAGKTNRKYQHDIARVFSQALPTLIHVRRMNTRATISVVTSTTYKSRRYYSEKNRVENGGVSIRLVVEEEGWY